MDLGFKGKLVLVAGATGAIGQAVCERLVAEGARLVLLGRDAGKLDATSESLSDDGSVRVEVMDLNDQEVFDRALESVIDAHGVPDVLVSAAGSTERISADDVEADDFLVAMESKLIPNVRLVLGVGRAMCTRGSGRIVVVSGVGGVQPMDVHLSGGAANAALGLFSTGFARHLIKSGVTLNTVNPGAVESPRLAGHLAASQSGSSMTEGEAREILTNRIPAARFAAPEEIADVILFMASDRSSFMVSTTVNVDGGQVVGP